MTPSAGVQAETNERLAQLTQWEAAAQREVDELSAELAQLQHRLNAAREQVELLRRLILVTGKGDSDIATVPRPAAMDWSLRSDLENHVEQILESAGEPIHISEIRRLLIERGVPLPGRGDDSNIIVRLSRASETFIRTARGTYGLASWGLPAMPRPNRRRKSKK